LDKPLIVVATPPALVVSVLSSVWAVAEEREVKMRMRRKGRRVDVVIRVKLGKGG